MLFCVGHTNKQTNKQTDLARETPHQFPGVLVPRLSLVSIDCCRGGRERLAFSVLWEMDGEANVLKTSFHKTIIKSSAALTYQEAQCMIDDSRDKSDTHTPTRQQQLQQQGCCVNCLYTAASGCCLGCLRRSPLAENLRELLRLSQILRRRRMQAGGLQLASPDVQVIRQTIAEAPEAGAKAVDVSVETVEQEAVDIALYQARQTNKMVSKRNNIQRR